MDLDISGRPLDAMSSAVQYIDIVVRFSTSQPDIVLTIVDPSCVSILSLKQQIRAELHSPVKESRLRLIHSGRVLQDTAALLKSLNITPAPPKARADGDGNHVALSAKAKGKSPIHEGRSRVYIHCSIGDGLEPTELANEREAALEADSSLARATLSITPSTPTRDGALQSSNAATTTAPAPRGFDRLLSAGFNASEVAALRAQFLAIQAHTHTPDAMPMGQELLAMEERWLDSGSGAGGGAGDRGGVDAGVFGPEDTGGLEDMLYGNLIGFFWPIGAMCWLMREEGVWSRRRQIAVFSGFMVNLLFGGLKWIT